MRGTTELVCYDRFMLRWLFRGLCLGGALLAMVAWPFSTLAASINGFEIDDPLVPANQIMHGGPPRDGIPAIDDPRYVRAYQASFLKEDDRVLGVFYGGQAKAYSIGILNYHELVNDRFGSERLVVSFCPLCGTGMVFKADVEGKSLSFGVSGLLYNSDLLMYDRQTESLWSQIEGKAVNGVLKGHSLVQLPATHTTWSAWKKAHPDTLVLSPETGHVRDYSRSPYPGYALSEYTYFPVSSTNRKYHPKERVLGIHLGGQTKVYPFVELSKTGKSEIRDVLGDHEVVVRFDAENRSGIILNEKGETLVSVDAFWFAWMAFFPDSLVFTHDP